MAVPAASPRVADEEPILNIYNWADYIHPDIIGNFERETGIAVNYDLYDSTEVVEAKLLAGSTGYDVVFHGFRYSARLIPMGIYRPLDRDQLPNHRNLDPWVLAAMDPYDPGNRYGIPYMWGSTGFAYNVDMVRARLPDAPLDSGAMLFDPAVLAKLADCGVTWTDEPTDVIPMALIHLGLDLNSTDPDDLAAAEAVLKAARPYIRYFSSTRMINDLPNGEVCVAMSWSGDYGLALARAHEAGIDVHLEYAAPREGSLLFSDGIFITAGAAHPRNAHRFLDYMMRPEVIALASDFTHYQNANLASVPFVNPEIVNNPALYLPPEVRDRMLFGKIHGPKQERQRTRAWARVKTGL